MNPQLERLFHSIRRGIEENVMEALRKMELPSQKDLQALKKRIEQLKKKELAPLARKLDEIKESLTWVESLKPKSKIKRKTKAKRKAKK